MEIRYLGFEQKQNSRAYRFDVREEGLPSRQLTVIADMDVFRTHRVGIQEGPILCGSKLSADLERGWQGEHELTVGDMRAYVASRSAAEAQRAEMRKHSRRRAVPAEAHEKSPWRNFGV